MCMCHHSNKAINMTAHITAKGKQNCWGPQQYLQKGVIKIVAARQLHFNHIIFFKNCIICGKWWEVADGVIHGYTGWESNAPFNLPLCILVDIPSLPIPNNEPKVRMQISKKVAIKSNNTQIDVLLSYERVALLTKVNNLRFWLALRHNQLQSICCKGGKTTLAFHFWY